MATTQIDTASCSFALDDDTLRYAQKKSAGFASRKQQLAAGAVGGLVGGLILAQHVQSGFFARLVTPPGNYNLSVTQVGIQLSGFGDHQAIFRWTEIERWAADKKIFMARDNAGNTIVLPRAGVPESIFSMIVEICTLTARSAERSISRGSFGKWSQLGAGEKIVRGVVYTMGVLVLVFAILVFATVAFGPSA